MTQKTMLAKAIRTAVLGISAAALIPTAATVYAQDSIEEVMVTGSRIARDEFSSASPISSFDSEELAISGVASIDEFLKDIPAFTGYQLGTSTNNGSETGQKKIDMRGLGFNRTLVLVNGRRMIGDSYRDGAVDLNNIPEAMIERVEVLKDGASTIYGSDALAGVVNFILRDEFEGVEVNFDYGKGTEDGQAKNDGISILAGISGDRGNMVMSLGYSSQDTMIQDEKSFARGALWSVHQGDGNFALEPGGSSNSRTARLTGVPGFADGSWVVDNGVPRPFASQDLYDYGSVNALVTPNERWQFGALGTIKINDNVESYFEGLYTRRTSHYLLAPDASFQVTQTIETPNNGIQWNDFVPANNPFNPFGADVRVNRRFDESGGRLFEATSDTYRFVAGVNGTLFDDSLSWDVSYTYSENEMVEETFNYGRFDNWAIAVDPVACAANATCAAAGVLDPFSEFGGISAAQMDFLTTGGLKDVYGSKMEMFALNLSGDLFEMSGGTAGWAVGFEHRRESGYFRGDEFKSSGLTTSGASDPVDGKYSVDEVFGEVYLPITDTFNANASFRYSDYDNSAGESTTFKLGADWAVVEDLRLRATYATGFRAPNIAELTQAEQTDFPVTISLCEFGDRALAAGEISQTVHDNCTAMGIPTDDSGEFGFPWQTTVTASAPVAGVDPELEPEESTSINFGFVYTPSFLEGLQVSVDYWEIEVDDVIDVPDANDLYRTCMNSVNLSSPACSVYSDYAGPHDTANFSIFPADANVVLGNLGKLTSKGYDFDVLYNGELNSDWASGYTLSWTATKHDSYEREYPLTGTTELVGTATGFEVFPEWRMQFGASLFGENWSINYKARFIDETKDRLRSSLLSADNVAEDVTYHDLVGTYTWNNVSFTAGVTNLTDEEPPYFHTAFNANTEPGTYDVIGRRMFTSVNLKF
ncbi:MAG: hypothetical protein CL693_09035 [Cellvibrionaceae bacterium]|nr:hypothetical protein [Cellvibrionaceae bacterium]